MIVQKFMEEGKPLPEGSEDWVEDLPRAAPHRGHG